MSSDVRLEDHPDVTPEIREVLQWFMGSHVGKGEIMCNCWGCQRAKGLLMKIAKPPKAPLVKDEVGAFKTPNSM